MAAVALGLGLAALAAGCGTVSMPVPDSLAQVEPMPVSGRQGFRLRGRTIRFGEWTARVTDEPDRTGRDREGVVTRTTERRMRWAFEMSGPGAALQVGCDATGTESNVPVGGVEVETASASSLDCSIAGAADRAERTLRLRRDRGDDPLAGSVEGPASAWTVAGTDRLARGPRQDAATGYVVRDGDATLAAVEVIDDGRVWIAPGPAEQDRAALAAVAAALLIFEEPVE